MEKVICTVANGEYKKYIPLVSYGIKKYAKIHDFKTRICKRWRDKNRPPHFEKIYLILALMKKYDIIFYVDCDTKFVDFKISIMDEYDDEHWIYMAKEPYGFCNSGVILVKTCDKSREFFKDCLRLDWKKWGLYRDQSVILRLLGWDYTGIGKHKGVYFKEETKYTNGLKILDPKWNYMLKHIIHFSEYYEGIKPVIIHYTMKRERLKK